MAVDGAIVLSAATWQSECDQMNADKKRRTLRRRNRIERPGLAAHFRLEELEPRRVLQAAGMEDSSRASWFATFSSPPSLTEQVGSFSASAGPLLSEAEPSRWIVTLREGGPSVNSVPTAAAALASVTPLFHQVRGLGAAGVVVAQSLANPYMVEEALSAHPLVASFERDQTYAGQVMPNDAFFNELTGLHNTGQYGGTDDADIDAVEAWEITTGSPTVAVGVIDSGIDYTHLDLYLNIWINQGEIPAECRAAVVDTDADELITFWDLNAPANAGAAADHNGDARIDARDLFEDPRWADGVDTEANGFTDDLFGWNFVTGEPFAPNDPQDPVGHGTHVAGTIGAIGNNGIGVTGVNWRSSLMALRILDENNQGSTASALAAIHYATMMREDFGVNVPVLNASWGQAGGFSEALRTAISEAGDGGILLVAAAGNGNLLGRGVNNDEAPFFPASYDLENVIAVAASDANDQLATFSNFGATSVDLAAPGVGVKSTQTGGGYATVNGTSMATPHVAGTAALVWSRVPYATVGEVRKAVLGGVQTASDGLPAELGLRLASGGRLTTNSPLVAQVFAPHAHVTSAADIVSISTDPHVLHVEYTDVEGIVVDSLDDADVVVQRRGAMDAPLPTTLVRWGARPNAAVIAEVEPNNSFDIAQATDSADWDTNYDRRITDSRETPHLSIDGTGDGTLDVFRFSAAVGATVRIDVDFPAGEEHEFAPRVRLLAADGAEIGHWEPDTPDSEDAENDLGWLTMLSAGGVYAVEIGLADNNTSEPIPSGVAYRLHLSVSDHATAPPDYKSVFADYELSPSGTIWDFFTGLPQPVLTWNPRDTGSYDVAIVEDQVEGESGLSVAAHVVPAFAVEITGSDIIYVNSTIDAADATPGDGFVDDGFGRITLRAAIQEASRTSTPHTIVLPAGHFLLTIEGKDEDLGATGDLDIRSLGPGALTRLTIVGAGSGQTIIDGNYLDRVFDVNEAYVDMHRLTITRGGFEFAEGETKGGAIRNFEKWLLLFDAEVSSSKAAYGGGIHNSEAGVILQRVSISNNRAYLNGGGIYNGGVATVDESHITLNSAENDGGGIASQSTFTMRQSALTHNVAGHFGGGFAAREAGLFAQTVIDNTTVAHNFGGIIGGV